MDLHIFFDISVMVLYSICCNRSYVLMVKNMILIFVRIFMIFVRICLLFDQICLIVVIMSVYIFYIYAHFMGFINIYSENDHNLNVYINEVKLMAYLNLNDCLIKLFILYNLYNLYVLYIKQKLYKILIYAHIKLKI